MAEHALADPFARSLFDRALLRGTFTLRSGVTSNRYFDKYRATCHPGTLRELGERLAATVRQHAPDAELLAAPELGGVPLAAATALSSNLPYVIVRASGKRYGTGQRIEGPHAAGQRAVLIEDIVTSGGAALEAIAAAREAGLVVERCFCVLDRGGGGSEALAAAGAPLVPLLDALDLEAAWQAGLGMQAGDA